MYSTPMIIGFIVLIVLIPILVFFMILIVIIIIILVLGFIDVRTIVPVGRVVSLIILLVPSI